jgi:hypothetical protein
MNKFTNQKSKLIALCAAAVAVVALVIGLIVNFSGNDKTDVEVAWEDLVEESSVEESSVEESSTELSSEEETETSTEEEIVYEAPDYDFNIDEITVEIEGLDREYRISWVSDVHLITDHEAGGDVQPEYLDTLDERYNQLPVDENGLHSDEFWDEIIKYINYENFDLAIFGGDIMDYCSTSNVETVKEGLDSLRMGYMYIRSDHDYGTWYGNYKFTDSVASELQKTIDGDEISRKFFDFGDFIVLGIDNSYMDMPEYYLNMVEEVYSRGKPVIMATHVPYGSLVDDSLAELSMKERNTLYYWGGKYQPNEITSKYLDLIYDENTVVAQVLAGHMHASWDGMISDTLSEHIFAPSYAGNIGVINVVPKK